MLLDPRVWVAVEATARRVVHVVGNHGLPVGRRVGVGGVATAMGDVDRVFGAASSRSWRVNGQPLTVLVSSYLKPGTQSPAGVLEARVRMACRISAIERRSQSTRRRWSLPAESGWQCALRRWAERSDGAGVGDTISDKPHATVGP
jgi:hypothetical protein